MFSRMGALVALCLFVFVPVVSSQNYATQVLQFLQGPGSGIFAPTNSLGGPDFASSGFQSVLSLGQGGQATFGFGVVVANGPGADFVVFENSFELLTPPDFLEFNGKSFAEVAFCEVSTNGIQFARFPTSYNGPAAPHPVFGGTFMGSFSGFAGAGPVYADVGMGGIDPRNAALAGGDAFDLTDLIDHPFVLSGDVDLSNINFVRLIDVAEGTATDSLGRTIWDDRGNDPQDSADIDAIAVIQHQGNQSPLAPTVGIESDVFNHLVIDISDPQGLQAIDLGSFSVSLNHRSLSSPEFFAFFEVSAISANAIQFRSTVPVTVAGQDFLFGVFVANLSQKIATTTFAVQL